MTDRSQRPEHGPEHGQHEPGLLDALVAAERASMEPPVNAERETWSRVAASVAVSGPPPIEPSSIGGPTAAAASLWVKIVLGVVVGGVVAVAGYRLGSDPQPEDATVAAERSSSESRERPPAPVLPPEQLPPRAVAPAPERFAAVATGEPPPTVAVDEAEPSKKSRAAPAAPTDPPASDLAEETRLLARARARLRAGSPSDALAPLSEHARRYPQGQLTEDRMVLRAQALCDAGKTKAGRQEASALRKAFPSSSHLPRVDRSCRP